MFTSTECTKDIDQEKFYLKQLVDNVPEYLFWKDANSVFLGCNKNFAVVAGLSNSSEIVGKTDYDLPWGEIEGDAYRADDLYVMSAKQGRFNVEETQTTPGGTVTLLTSKVPLFDYQGCVCGIIGVYSDITVLKNMQLKLEQEKLHAEAANRAKTEFLANMSHDVKTPLTGIVGMADIIMHDTNAREHERKRAEAIHACGMQVVSLFNSCLELSKLEMQEWFSKEEDFSLEILLQEMRALFTPSAETKNLTLITDYDKNLPNTVRAHRAGLYRVMLNLVGNALKFTQKGSVSIRVFLTMPSRAQRVEVGIEVKDTGVGIPEDKQQVIFEKLHRLAPAYEGKIEGSGIGLYIVDQYIKRMGGSIKVDSMLGEGSAFTVFLPMTIVAEAEITENVSTPSAPASATLVSRRILLVEDNVMAQHVTKALLNTIGCDVDIAATGTEAIEKFSSGKYSLVYMDIGLPDIDGYEVTQAIRKKEKLSGAAITPIVALTGHGAVDVQKFCGDAGMQGVLSKPLTREQAEDVWRRYGEGLNVNVKGLLVIEN